MNLPIYYCTSWFRMKKHAIDPMSETRAQSRHVSGESYTALIGSDSAPTCFVELFLNKGMVGVGFLDQYSREYLTYQFQITNPDNLFLTMATHREFETIGDEIIAGQCYIFNEQGEVFIRRETFNPHSLEEARSNFDPARHYEKIPEFGCYSDLTKTDR